jgi:hypothetical protein
MKNKLTKQELTLEFLEDRKIASTSRIANHLHLSFFQTQTILEELLKQKKVRFIKEKDKTFWERKDETK